MSRVGQRLPVCIDRMAALAVQPSDSLVVTGFWRSGTTWLQSMLAECLRAKTVFEACEQEILQRYYEAGSQLPRPWPRSTPKAYMPFCEKPIPHGSALYLLFLDSLRGSVDGRRVRINRRRLLDAFRTRVVAKFVRAQLCIVGMALTFGARTVHIHRDPRPMMASILRDKWGTSWLQGLSLRDNLLRPDDGRATYFGQWSREIAFHDRKGFIERVTAYWALTENYVQHSQERYGIPRAAIAYEKVLREGPGSVAELLRNLGETAARLPAAVYAADSVMTTGSRRSSAASERLSGWKKELASSDAHKIEETARRFGLEDRLSTD